MDIIVCVKRTPDTNAKIKIAKDSKQIEQIGIEWIINPYDEYAIEEALRQKERLGGSVCAISLDPDANQTILRKALAMGVDKAILIHGGANFDSYPVAKILAEQISKLKFDLILFGKQAVDDDNYQVPTIVAQLLDLPRANVVTKLQIQDNKVICHRQIEGAEEIVEMSLPCIISCQKGLNEPRYPSLKGIMEAKKKPLEEILHPDLEPTLEIIKLEEPPKRPAGRIVGQGPQAVGELVRLLRNEAKVL